jgi:hypothetical protein
VRFFANSVLFVDAAYLILPFTNENLYLLQHSFTLGQRPPMTLPAPPLVEGCGRHFTHYGWKEGFKMVWSSQVRPTSVGSHALTNEVEQ